MSELSDLILNELKREPNQKAKHIANKFNVDRKLLTILLYSVFCIRRQGKIK